ncbi:MAG: hypothetical protein A3B74_02260 [Candidatus Kerfeldbacteria bacterium RIFCSPHIGHO2_02_FULL_42_14]|uniref:Uncharacterized protein n=1 Tax=Candidatus Kerfeldbacteria bacterium RIFCSPHIGHO2_02_FULL_42_14 TaxID=1798540 RepID=A0A1G2ARP3_9BACT|nr:MAG: hypothetical protein A3B74_02260 [Candidatus Kerfeldbacteria bacterium RIFCSPHIGHO2_02_FULL_42_14]OGY80372.1 MAG: hypothetical protein A3E60_04880 [Candidatus Kerfeldbacteria bacterium RIFCSPHIGHO2_12_FULL_42_13]OGY83801.1 MAG: hypothetical protein A3I91_04405 [Candidatus Kerfeldbacteria bacterium RIFCSPLOWO2_02_FULL_42_19]OGY87132.1 MAG: hypothetical protein A3G01_04605 [Candidatus Kerfeldbacteria bacterium RIFCSPLOWO2_12_FULL_43_9]
MKIEIGGAKKNPETPDSWHLFCGKLPEGYEMMKVQDVLWAVFKLMWGKIEEPNFEALSDEVLGNDVDLTGVVNDVDSTESPYRPIILVASQRLVDYINARIRPDAQQNLWGTIQVDFFINKNKQKMPK